MSDQDIVFYFNASWYSAIVPYGHHFAQVDVMVLPTKLGYDSEDVIVRVPTLHERVFNKITYYHPTERIPRLYAEWPPTLGPELTRHIMTIADKLLEGMEISLYNRRKRLHYRR